jgi:hypothetical protein
LIEKSSLPPVYFDLTSVDGNCYSLLGNWAAAARRAKWSKEHIDRVLADAKGGDYNHLITVLQDNSVDIPIAEDDAGLDGDDHVDDGDEEDE